MYKDERQLKIESLIATLKLASDEEKELAAMMLGTMKAGQSIDILIEIVETDSIASVRKAAIKALGEMRTTKALTSIITEFLNPNSEVRCEAACSLGLLGTDRAIEALLEVANNIEVITDEDLRLSILEALGSMKTDKSIPVLIKSLSDESEYIRDLSAEYLGRLKAEVAVPALIKSLNDCSADVRESAAQALGEIQKPKAIIPLITLLKDKEEDVRSAAIVSLEDILGFKVLKTVLGLSSGIQFRRLSPIEADKLIAKASLHYLEA